MDDPSLFQKASAWFEAFTLSFGHPQDPPYNPYQLKREHSRRVANDCRAIATELKADDFIVTAALLAGLLHDTGRFPQFRDYQTFSDADSINHGQLSSEILSETPVVQTWPNRLRDAVLPAIQFHGAKDVPESVRGEAALVISILRDADKLDIIDVLCRAIKNRWDQQHPSFLLNIKGDAPPNPQLMQTLKKGSSVAYSQIRSLADLSLLRMAWAYELNHRPSIQRFLARDLLGKLTRSLPFFPEMQPFRLQVEADMQQRLATPDT